MQLQTAGFKGNAAKYASVPNNFNRSVVKDHLSTYHIMKFLAPDMFTSVPNVVTVGDTSNWTSRKLL